MIDSKYLKFELIETKPKTKVYVVISKMHDYQLGIIKWFTNWRCYAFYPGNGTIWEDDCLSAITQFLKNLQSWHLNGYKECICGHNGVTTISHLDIIPQKTMD